jgi:hypothetical protein
LSALAPAGGAVGDGRGLSQDGVVNAFFCPNPTPIRRDRLLLDDSALASRREVTVMRPGGSVVAQQRALTTWKSKGELAAATGRVSEKRPNSLVEGSLDRVVVISRTRRNRRMATPRPGGNLKPASADATGDPREAGVLAWLPVADALNLSPARHCSRTPNR